MDTVLSVLTVLVLLLVLAWAIAKFLFAGSDLGYLDQPIPPPRGAPPGEGHAAVLERLRRVGQTPPGIGWRQRVALLRERLDALGAETPVDGFRILSADCAGIPAEWVLAPDSDPARRVLYIHGGAFSMGSPLSHRALTTAFARRARASVLAIDYRLLPENRRLDCLEDCARAYRWVLDNGPEGPGAPRCLVMAGDSAGGNLALATAALARDERLRPADAVIALSPATDATLSSPSLRANLPTDPMLGPQFGSMVSQPRILLLWIGWFMNRVRPCDPRVSPVYGDLAGLPPTLVQASEAEMLLDDARRYVARARAAGSPVRLQTWPYMVHVWQIFHPLLEEGREAMEKIGVFIDEHAPP